MLCPEGGGECVIHSVFVNIHIRYVDFVLVELYLSGNESRLRFDCGLFSKVSLAAHLVLGVCVAVARPL